MSTRGQRNNNPGNIVHSRSRWLGKSEKQTDSKFVQFVSLDYGIRAMMILISNYIKKGFDTPEKIVNRYCPPSDGASSNLAYRKFIGVFLTMDNPIKKYSSEFYTLVTKMIYFESLMFVSEVDLILLKKKFKLC